ncbi:MAG: T9SS type A sorting domain-containing protein [Ignavibacterium sp.]|jgi:hypothetical protein
MITKKRAGTLIVCFLSVLAAGRGQTTSIPWSSFSQALEFSGGSGTRIASHVGHAVTGASSGGATKLIGGFLAGLSQQSAITSVEGGTSLPLTYELYQNYPNPFNPTTTISYDLPALSRVTIHVFNLVGQQITTLVDQEQPPGRYKLVWNGRTDSGVSASSGVYFYRILAKERSGEERQFSSTRKFLLLK